MKQSTINLIFLISIISLIILSLIIFMGILITLTDVLIFSADYKTYCVEWDGWIHRDNMILNCFDFENLTPRCSWEVTEKHELIITPYNVSNGNLTDNRFIGVYNCSEYIRLYSFSYSSQDD